MAYPIAANSKSVRLGGVRVYDYYGFVFEVPIDEDFMGIQYDDKDYFIITDKQTFVVKACLKCKRFLHYDHFYEGVSPCKDCRTILCKDWKKRHPEQHRLLQEKANKKYRKKVYKDQLALALKTAVVK